MLNQWLTLCVLSSCAVTASAYVTCQSNYEDAFQKKEEYYCKDGENCCSSGKAWFGCCPRDPGVLETPISVRQVLIIVGGLIAVTLFILMCYCICRNRKKRSSSLGRGRCEEGRKGDPAGPVTQTSMLPSAPPMRDLPPAYEDIASSAHHQNHHQIYRHNQQAYLADPGDSSYLVRCE